MADLAPIPILSMATSGLNSTRIRHFAASAAVWGVEFRMLGVGQKWGGFGWMAHQYAAEVAKLPPEQIAIVMDCTDAFVQAGELDIRAAFTAAAAGKPIVLSLETGCPRTRCTEAPAAKGEVEAAEKKVGISSLTHVNGGFVIGRAWALKRLWDYAANHSCCTNTRRNKWPSAQLGIGRFMLAHPELVAVDRTQQLIAVINNMRSNEWRRHYELTNFTQPQRDPAGKGLETWHRARNVHSRVAACFVHMPGIHEVYRKTYKTNIRIMVPFDTVDAALTPKRPVIA